MSATVGNLKHNDSSTPHEVSLSVFLTNDYSLSCLKALAWRLQGYAQMGLNKYLSPDSLLGLHVRHQVHACLLLSTTPRWSQVVEGLEVSEISTILQYASVCAGMHLLIACSVTKTMQHARRGFCLCIKSPPGSLPGWPGHLCLQCQADLHCDTIYTYTALTHLHKI